MPNKLKNMDCLWAVHIFVDLLKKIVYNVEKFFSEKENRMEKKFDSVAFDNRSFADHTTEYMLCLALDVGEES